MNLQENYIENENFYFIFLLLYRIQGVPWYGGQTDTIESIENLIKKYIQICFLKELRSLKCAVCLFSLYI